MRYTLYLLLFFSCFLANTLQAQQKLSGEGATNKKYLDTYMRKLKTLDATKYPAQFQTALDNAKQYLEKLKKSDPTYDVSDIEKEIQSYTSSSLTTAPQEGSYDYLLVKINAYKKLYESEYDFIHSARGDQNPVPVSGAQYLQIAQGFEKIKVEKATSDYLLANPNKNNVELFKKDLANYESYIKYSGILKHATKLAQNAYELNAQKNNVKAIESAENALGYVKGVLLLSPENADAKQTLIVVQKAYDAVASELGKNLSSNYHKSHINRIVFSKKPLVIGSESDADVSSSFKSDETIYGTIYFSDKLINLLSTENQAKFFIAFSINGDACHFYESHVTVNEADKQKSYLQFAIVPDEMYDFGKDVSNKNNTIRDFNQTIAKKAPMTFRIGINGSLSKTSENLYGEFTYDLSSGHSMSDKIVNKIDEIQTEQARLPKARMTDASLLSKMTSLLNDNTTGAKYSLGRIVSTGWNINKNSLGVIIDRSVSAYFLVTYPDGHCEYAAHTFSQEYSGGGTYSTKLTVIISPFDHGKMKCENANK